MISCDCGSTTIIMLDEKKYDYPLWMCLKCRSVYELDITTKGIKKDLSKSPSDDLDYFDTTYLPESCVAIGEKIRGIAMDVEVFKNQERSFLILQELKKLHYSIVKEIVEND